MINEVGRYRSDGTQAAVIERRVSIALDFQQNAIPHMEQNAATSMATAANAFKNGATWLRTLLQRSSWLSDVHASASKALRQQSQDREVSHRPRNIGLISIKGIIRAEGSGSLVESAAQHAFDAVADYVRRYRSALVGNDQLAKLDGGQLALWFGSILLNRYTATECRTLELGR